MRVLVSGCGSIGQRHARNLHSVGITELAVCDPDTDRTGPIAEELAIDSYDCFSKALTDFKPEAVFVCTPPVHHVSQSKRAIESGTHLFIEKPLSHSLAGLDELIEKAASSHRIVQVGYNLRFHPGIRELKRIVETDAIGTILWGRLEVGQYLPEWRPWQDYRQSYTARSELGGGIILDASHELDYACWFFGEPIEIKCMAGRVSNLETDVEDCASILLRFDSGAQIDIHMDFIQRCYSRSCKLVGSKGTAIWDYGTNEIKTWTTRTQTWETTKHPCEPNDMYIAEILHFMECVRAGTAPLSDLEQGRKVLKTALIAKTAANLNNGASSPCPT